MSIHERKNETPFKRCTLCGTVWTTKEEFLADAEIQLNGYQFTGRRHANTSRGGMLIFTHHHTSCGTTLAVYARQLKDFALEQIERE